MYRSVFFFDIAQRGIKLKSSSKRNGESNEKGFSIESSSNNYEENFQVSLFENFYFLHNLTILLSIVLSQQAA